MKILSQKRTDGLWLGCELGCDQYWRHHRDDQTVMWSVLYGTVCDTAYTFDVFVCVCVVQWCSRIEVRTDCPVRDHQQGLHSQVQSRVLASVVRRHKRLEVTSVDSTSTVNDTITVHFVKISLNHPPQHATRNRKSLLVMEVLKRMVPCDDLLHRLFVETETRTRRVTTCFPTHRDHGPKAIGWSRTNLLCRAEFVVPGQIPKRPWCNKIRRNILSWQRYTQFGYKRVGTWIDIITHILVRFMSLPFTSYRLLLFFIM